MNLIRVVAVLLAFGLVETSCGQEIVLSGKYQGKDIYVQNPFNKITKKFCTQGVYINEQLVLDKPSISAFRIDLSTYENNQLVVIKLTYEAGCEPLIVNPQALNEPQSFQFLLAQADNNSIVWTTRGELSGGTFVLQQNWNSKGWKAVDTIEAKGNFSTNRYAIKPFHKSGENGYRITYVSHDGRETMSEEFYHTAGEGYITFFPQVATTSLTLSDTAAYTIEDYFGKVVKKGEGREIPLLNIKPGKYYLIIQNRKEQFVKK